MLKNYIALPLITKAVSFSMKDLKQDGIKPLPMVNLLKGEYLV